MKPIEMYARAVRRVLKEFGKDDTSVRVITTELARFQGTPCLHDHVIVDDRDVRLFPTFIRVCGYTCGLAGVPLAGIHAAGGDVAIATH